MPELTPRQRQVLCLVTLTTLEIGIRLGITRQTVKNLLTGAYNRLGISDGTPTSKRTSALMLALRQGIVTLDEVEPPLQRLLSGWDRERFGQAHSASWRENRGGLMYSPWLHKWIDRLSNIGKRLRGAFAWLFAPQRIVIACFIIALIGVGFEYGPSLPGCGGPISPLPTPTVTATPEPTPTLPLPPVSPLETPPW